MRMINCQRDVRAVADLERCCFDHPWSALELQMALVQLGCFGVVEEWDDAVIGYMVFEVGKRQVKLLNIAVAEQCRRRGIASKLLSELPRREIVLEVRETNVAAQLFFRVNGFRYVRTLKGYYDDVQEDAYEMRHCPPSNAR
jgi:ribosomal-protein-alanine N-acetyltransferase